MKNFLFKAPFAIARKLGALEPSVSLEALGIPADIKFAFGRAPHVTRFGSDLRDRKTPFYEADLTKLLHIYPGYASDLQVKHGLSYVELTAIASGDYFPIAEPALIWEEASLRIMPVPYRVPAGLHDHVRQAIDLFQSIEKLRMIDGEWENNRCLSLASIGPAGVEARFATYFDQVATNLSLDWESRKLGAIGPTIRAKLEAPVDGKLPPLQGSCLANTLGTAVMMYTRDLSPLLRFRNETLASIPHAGLHCTASGVLELPADVGPGRHTLDILRWGMEQEIEHEIGLTPDQYDLFPVAFARELPRGGKPQLFWAAVAKVDLGEIQRAAAASREAHEFVPNEFDELFQQRPDGAPQFLSRFTYEGIACLQYAQDFIAANGHRWV